MFPIDCCMYRGDEAVAHLEDAWGLDPLSPTIHYVAAMAFNIARNFERAERAAILSRAPNYVGLSDRQGVAEALEACLEDSTPPLPIQTSIGPWLDQFRDDPRIDRALDRLYDGARPRPLHP